MPLLGSNSGGTNNGCWHVVAFESVILPPHSEGLVIGKIKGYNDKELPGEVLVEPLELGTPGAYVARVMSRLLTSRNLSELKGQRKDCRVSKIKEIGTDVNLNKVDRVKTDQQDGNVRYCTLKVLNTRGQHLELGKNVLLGQAEPLEGTPPKGAGIDFRSTEWRDMAAHRISSLTGRNSREVREKRDQLEEKLKHLPPSEKHILLSVMEEYVDLFCNEETGVLPNTTKGRHEIRTGDALPIKKNPYRVPYALKEEM
jgi:hypothetical protein